MTALLRHSTAPDQQDASLSIAEIMACGRVCAKLAAFRRLSYKLLNRQMFMTCEFTKYVWNTRAEEIGLDYEPFCEACEMFAPLVNCLLRYNKQEKQRFQIGLLSPDAELTAYLRPNEWIPAGMSYNTIFNEYDQTFGDPALLPIRVSVRALQGHSASLRVNASSIMEPITCSEDLQSDVFLVHGTFFKAWKIMDPTSPDVDNYEYNSILRRDGGPGNNRESRHLHFLPASVLKDQPQAMRRNCDILLVFCASDLLRVALEAASDLDYQNMLHSGGRDNQDVLPHTMWRAANGCVCGDFDVKLGENLLGAYDVRRRKWLLDDPFIRDKDNANMIRSPIAAYVAYWQHQNPDVPALNTGRPESEDRSRSRDPRPPGSRTGPSAQRDPGWGKRQLERTRSHYLGPVLGRERRSPSAGVRENTPDFGARGQITSARRRSCSDVVQVTSRVNFPAFEIKPVRETCSNYGFSSASGAHQTESYLPRVQRGAGLQSIITRWPCPAQSQPRWSSEVTSQVHVALAMAGQLRSLSYQGRREPSVPESRVALAADLPLVASIEDVLSVVRLRPVRGEHLRPGERFVRVLRPARSPEKATIMRTFRTRSLSSGTVARVLPTWS